MKNEFTLKNILKQWIKLWPVVVLCTVCGIAGSFVYAKNIEAKYVASINVLIRNNDKSASSGDYLFLLSSDSVTHTLSNNSCEYDAKVDGNVLILSTSCTSSPEDARIFLENIFDQFKQIVGDIYGDDAVEIIPLNNIKNGQEEYSNKPSRAIVIFIASIFVSIIIAFISLDYKITKNEKKE